MRVDKEISKEALKDFEIKHYEGPIVVVEDAKAITTVVRELQGYEMLGFDTESKPQFKKGKPNNIALLQFATPKEVYLVRVNKTGFPGPLVQFFNDYPGKICGIGLDDDWREIRRAGIEIHPKDVVDLNKMARKKGFESIGAKKLSALLLGFTISKRQQISNWEAQALSEAQIYYAATDAWICRDIYKKLKAL